MRKALIVFSVGLALAGAAFASLGSVVASWPAPQHQPMGMARASNPAYMWVLCISAPARIYRMHAETGTVYGSFYTYFGKYTRGLTYQAGGYLYIGNYQTDLVYRCSYVNGSVYSWFDPGHEINGGFALQCDAGGFNPTAIFTSGWLYPKRVWRQNQVTGSIYNSFTSDGLFDLAWDYKNDLVWGAGHDYWIYGHTSSGSLVASFESPTYNPAGLCYYNDYLWLCTTAGPGYPSPDQDRVWKIHCPEGLDSGSTNITPASAGKIKALYH